METKALSPYPERTILGMLKSTTTKLGSPSRLLKKYSEVLIFAHDLWRTLEMDTQAVLVTESDHFSELAVRITESRWEAVTTGVAFNKGRFEKWHKKWREVLSDHDV